MDPSCWRTSSAFSCVALFPWKAKEPHAELSFALPQPQFGNSRYALQKLKPMRICSSPVRLCRSKGCKAVPGKFEQSRIVGYPLRQKASRRKSHCLHLTIGTDLARNFPWHFCCFPNRGFFV